MSNFEDDDIIDVEIVKPRPFWKLFVGAAVFAGIIGYQAWLLKDQFMPAPSTPSPTSVVQPVYTEVRAGVEEVGQASSELPGCAVQQVCILGTVESIQRDSSGTWVTTESGTFDVCQEPSPKGLSL